MIEDDLWSRMIIYGWEKMIIYESNLHKNE